MARPPLRPSLPRDDRADLAVLAAVEFYPEATTRGVATVRSAAPRLLARVAREDPDYPEERWGCRGRRPRVAARANP
eukprot:30628-Pelagococcus_subviridis.AAC.1